MKRKISSYFKITIVYFLFGVLWIYFSDSTINFFVKDLEKLQFLKTIKGCLFIIISSIILYFFSKQQFIKLQNEKNQLKEQEELLIQQSRLASMGEMIANIAHQWRQPLSIISTLSTGIKLKKELGLSNEKNEIESLDTINQNSQYLSKTIDDFKNYFKKSTNTNTTYSKDLFEKTLKLISSRLKDKNIEVILNIKNIELETYENELVQVCINIINNSIDAFENITHDKYIFIKTKKEDANIIIEIKDNAGGVPKEIINRIFEPYFTTKHERQGTGLGLYICNEIVTKHLKGRIEVSKINFDYLKHNYKSSKFKIILPL